MFKKKLQFGHWQAIKNMTGWFPAFLSMTRGSVYYIKETHCLCAINKPPPTASNLNLICRYRVLRQLKNYDTLLSNKLRPLLVNTWVSLESRVLTYFFRWETSTVRWETKLNLLGSALITLELLKSNIILRKIFANAKLSKIFSKAQIKRKCKVIRVDFLSLQCSSAISFRFWMILQCVLAGKLL